MNWKGRKPNIKYFTHGCIEYFKDNETNNLMFHVVSWADSGLNWIKHQPYEVPTKEFVEDILACITLDDVQNVVEKHLNVKVIQK